MRVVDFQEKYLNKKKGEGKNDGGKTMKCTKCGEELQFAGFECKLIMRGKNKGKYTVENFYKPCVYCVKKREKQ